MPNYTSHQNNLQRFGEPKAKLRQFVACFQGQFMPKSSFFKFSVTIRYIKTVVLKTRYSYLKKTLRNKDFNKSRSGEPFNE